MTGTWFLASHAGLRRYLVESSLPDTTPASYPLYLYLIGWEVWTERS